MGKLRQIQYGLNQKKKKIREEVCLIKCITNRILPQSYSIDILEVMENLGTRSMLCIRINKQNKQNNMHSALTTYQQVTIGNNYIYLPLKASRFVIS